MPLRIPRPIILVLVPAGLFLALSPFVAAREDESLSRSEA